MRKLIVAEFITLDGVIQAPGAPDEDTDGGFVHGGWTHPYWHDDIGAHFSQAMAEADTLLLGRKTWQGSDLKIVAYRVGLGEWRNVWGEVTWQIALGENRKGCG